MRPIRYSAQGIHRNPVAAVSATAVQDDIPQQRVDDSQIRKYMQDINELILQHVENYYHGRSFQGRPDDLKRELVNCGYGGATEPSNEALYTLLSNPAARATAIRQLIASVVLHHIELKSDPATSLLPAPIAGFCQATLEVKRLPGQNDEFSKTFSKWRCLSASLLSSNASVGSETLVSDATLRAGVVRNVQLLHGVLHHFIKPGTESQRAQSDNLSSIILKGAHFGVLLFSQPSVWVFAWEAKRAAAGQGSGKSMVVFPGISEVTVRRGREHSRTLVDAVREQL